MILSLLGIGIIIGAVLTLLIWGGFSLVSSLKTKSALKQADKIDIETSSNNNLSEESKTSSEVSSKDDVVKQAPLPTYDGDTWVSEAVYQAGEQVQYANKIYKAKWWTQGDMPSQESDSNPWEFVSDVEIKKDNKEKEKGDKDMEKTSIKVSGKKDKGFKVVGYYPDWEPSKHDRIQYDVVTHIVYAFAIPNSDGTIKPLDNPGNAKKLISEAHKNGVKVIVAVGGWSYNDVPLEPAFKEATNSDEKINKFVDEMMKMVKEYNFDGIDVDWEHPRYGEPSQKQYEKLILALSKALKKENLLLTSAVLGGVSADGVVMYDAAAHTDKVLDAVDWLNVMAYDGGDGERHSSYDFAINCGKYWKDKRKMSQEKIVLGVPFYGRPSWSTYDAILKVNEDAHKSDISMINGMQAHYNGIETIQKKTKWAKQNLGGIMIWELSQDTIDKDKSLLSAIGKTIK